MKKTVLILAALTIPTTFSQAQVQGQFQITGHITKEMSCKIKADDITINPVTVDDLKTMEAPNSWSNKPGKIIFSECYLGINDGGRTAFIELEVQGNPSSTNSKYWASGQDTVGIELDIDGEIVPGTGTTQNISSEAITSDNAITEFTTRARVARISNDTIHPGEIGTTVSFIAHYK